MTTLASLSDRSDMPLVPGWVLWLVLGVCALLLVASVAATFRPAARRMPTPNAAPTETELRVSAARATNRACHLRGHAVSRVGEMWACLRDGCGETWLVMPEQEPYDQEAQA